jgi:hypothetical protein
MVTRGRRPWVGSVIGTLAGLLVVSALGWAVFHERGVEVRQTCELGLMVCCLVQLTVRPGDGALTFGVGPAFAGGAAGGLYAAVLSATIPGMSGPAAPHSLSARFAGEALWWLVLAVPFYMAAAAVTGRRPADDRMRLWPQFATILVAVGAWLIWGALLSSALRVLLPLLPPFHAG